MSAYEVWEVAKRDLQQQMTRGTYESWLAGTQGLSCDGGEFVVGVPNVYAEAWLENRLAGRISEVVSGLVGEQVRARFVVRRESANGRPGPSAQAGDNPRAPTVAREVPHTVSLNGGMAVEQVRPSSAFNPRYTFQSFIVGSNSQLAHAAAMAVADSPARRYNPLFVYGGVGLGKTHLLHAIGHATMAGVARVVYVSSEVFTNELINAIRERNTEAFRARYRASDVLLIDDIQFIAGKESTQEEFFHTFNALHGSERQIVVTSDRHPQALTTLEERLRSRFEGGLIADIAPPDLETRLAILRAKAEKHAEHVPDEVLEMIGHTVQRNIRELEGALTRVVAHAQLMQQPLTVETARATLAELFARRQAPSLERIIRAVAAYYKITPADLKGRCRAARIAEPRQVAMYLMRQDAAASFPQIGAALGGRDHTTILHGHEKIGRLVDQDRALRADVMSLREHLYRAAELAMFD
jgi:chromosomal replication initiator protein